ncbi:MAG TPA: TatD family hydrolase [Clostridia bacterium]|nr:TatD family hydrolase [Clostridia bacterium]
MTALIDTHVHLMDERFREDVDQVIANAKAAGVVAMANVGYDLESSRQAVAMAQEEPCLYAVVGIHPHDAKLCTPEALRELEELARQPKVVAIGEIGLDYYRNLSPKEVQKEAFRQQIRLAQKLNKPIVVHDRDAHGDTIQILKEEKVSAIGGVLHCYSGSWEMAREAMKMGLFISLAGPVTFHNARRLQDIAKLMPLDYLLIETDCPYLAPEPYRGKRNEPAYVVKVAEMIAAVKRKSLEEIAQVTTANARRIFGIPS